MAHDYTAVLWNRQKKIYDWVIFAGVVLYLIAFVVFTILFNPEITQETLLIRATGTLALLMLHIILLIGPLARLDTRFLPLLYNRRHLGVSMFLVATAHAVLNVLQFHALGDVNPIVSVFVSNTDYTSLVHFPFQTLGALAWIILFLMASTSHDFWLANLGPKVWKGLHMLVYVAYVLVVIHVMLGVVQDEKPLSLIVLLALGVLSIISTHLLAGFKEAPKDKGLEGQEEFLFAGSVDEIENNKAKIVSVEGERVAIFKYDGKLSAISNVCRHQNGPLGEGRVIDGLVTCPWHGYQYRPHDGCSPPPFNEKVPTYELKLEGSKIFIRRSGNEPGTPVEPIKIGS